MAKQAYMLKKTGPLVLICIFCMIIPCAAAPSPSTATVPGNRPVPFTTENLLSLSPKEFEKVTGQHLSFKEKIAYRIVQWKLRKQLKPSEDTDGNISKAEKHSKNALFCGIVTWGATLLGLAVPVIGVLAIPFAIAAIIFGAISLNKTSSNTRSILGIVLGGLFLLLFVIALLSITTI